MKRVFLTTVAAMALAAPAFAQAPDPQTAPPTLPPTEAAQAADEEEAKWDVQNPPGPARDIPIDVTRGTWMSVDVSPDGRMIAFDLLGDIYVMPIEGGEARAIASGVAWEMQPKWSPDGRQIAFTSDRGGGDNLWIMDADGSNPVQVSKESFRLLNQPEWSPDGQFIVGRKHFTSARSLGAGEIWMYHRSGGGGVQMTERRTQQKDTGEPAFSPDGRYLYFSDDATPGDVFEYSKDVNEQIYVIRRLDRETGEIEPYVTGPGGSIRPTPSPDGKSLAFIRRVRYQSVLYVMDIQSGRETPVFSGLDRDLQETWAIHGVYPAISWTPDNRSIVFWADGRIQRVDVASGEVSDIPFHVADTRRVQEAVRFPVEVAPDTFDVKMIRWARPSPDGSRVVFEALGHLWIRDLPSGEARRLTRQNDHFELYPNWSRDGRSIVYATWDDEALGSVRVVPASGGTGRTITPRPGHYVEPTFSPDGRTVVYRTVSGGDLTSALWSRDTGVYRIPAAGGEPVFVTDDGVAPQFGADGDRLFLTGRDGDHRTLFSVDLDGDDARTHLRSEWAAEFALSPDGNWVGWTERFNAYVAPFVAAGRPVTISAEGKSLPQARVTRDAGEWLSWSGDSRRLQWSLGPELFTRDLNQSFAFVEGAPEELPKPDERGINLGFSVPADKPEGRMALTGARLITMNGAEVIENGVIVIDGNRIETIGPMASTTIPAGIPTLDMTGKTIMPGLIDAHWHGSMGEDEIIPEQSRINYAALAFGVTTIHDPSNDTSEIFAHSELARAGRVVGPRIFSTGTILYGATTAFTAQVDDLDDALSTLRRMQAAGAWSVKSYNQPRREQRQQILEAARQLGMMVVPEGGSLFQHNMSMIVDGHTTIEHSIPLARLYDDVHQLWRQTEVAYNPTLVVAYGGSYGENYWYQESDVWDHPILTQYVPRRVLDARARRPVTLPDNEWNHISVAREATRLNAEGVDVLIGAHGQREGLAAHWELWSLAQGGMAPLDVIRAGTLSGARALGMDRDLGSLEPGKLADMVVLDANPLENIRNTTSIAYTVANGRVYDSGMNEIAPRQRPRRPFWFAGADGEAFAPGATETDSHGHGGD
ncbi:MAG: PD40 domain-containing protein [Brevundimonas sp.]|uniref:amidohydrolase family protein n=1 Tax=Brevundimonas sp. TaxID=1871086 RepID=UPI001858A9CE|nr:amidohydrolase family protein [Brevundimonas sp.]MBA4803867.1 PD40 domain-containing protein [Brevundimonas sp.]